MTIINSHILTMDGTEFQSGYIEISGGKIQVVGDMKDYAAKENVCGSEVIDAGGRLTLPGFVEAHSHLGIWEDGLGFEGADGNEDTDPCTPHLRAIDAVNPFDYSFTEALLSGVTTAVTGAGSSNAIGGQLSAIKTYGKKIDDMIVKSPVAIKAALGENPKSTYNDKNQTPVTRMATAAIIREALFKASEYKTALDEYNSNPEENSKPDYDAKCEALIPVINKELPIHFHAHRADDIFTALRIAQEFDINIALVHCTEGHLIAEYLKGEGVPVFLGPLLTDRSKPELKNLSLSAPKIFSEHNIEFAITTDHPETPLKFLNLCAGIAVREGLSETDALRSITSAPARMLGIFDKVGSITCGKDADIVIWNDSPLSITAKPYIIIAGGNVIDLQ